MQNMVTNNKHKNDSQGHFKASRCTNGAERSHQELPRQH